MSKSTQKRTLKHTKKRNSDTNQRRKYIFVVFFILVMDQAWLMWLYNGTTRLVRLPVNVVRTCRDRPLIRLMIRRSVTDYHGCHVDGMTRIQNAGPGAFSSSLHVLPNCKFFRFSVQICVFLSAFLLPFAVGFLRFS